MNRFLLITSVFASKAPSMRRISIVKPRNPLIAKRVSVAIVMAIYSGKTRY